MILDADGFITVPKKKSAKAKKVQKAFSDDEPLELSISTESIPRYNSLISYSLTCCFILLIICRNISSAERELLSSQFYPTLWSTLAKAVEEGKTKPIKNIICLGLGKFSSCKIALHQLALLLLLRQELNCTAEVFDPAFSESEKGILGQLGLKVAVENCEGRRKADPGNISTLFILPHCPRELTNNLLYANWDPCSLENCIIYANSFESLKLNTPARFLRNYQYLLRVEPAVEEIAVPNSLRFPDVFNDLSLHLFPVRLLRQVPPEFWDSPQQPVYSEETELIIA